MVKPPRRGFGGGGLDTRNDDTVRISPKRGGGGARWAFGSLAALALAVAAAIFFLVRPAPIAIDTETEASIDATQPCATKVARFALDPSIVVVDFPDLLSQGLALNRVAALVEKANTPRDRVLDDVALNQAITSCGDTVESYYYGHDYNSADLARFFELAARQGIQLNPRELWLRRLARQLGWLQPGVTGALISLPAAAPPITEEMRAVILHHEISHGAFYTLPIYQHYAEAFWASLTPADRAAFALFLGRQGYDAGNTELMLNETQAYLIFTRDPRFFNGSVVNMTQAQIDTLRAGYIAGIPVPWLKPMADATLPVAPSVPVCG